MRKTKNAIPEKKKKPHWHLNCFLAKDYVVPADYASLLVSDVTLAPYPISPGLDITGRLFVKAPAEKPPSWYEMVKRIVGDDIDILRNKSSSAVLIFESANRTFAVTFGYGRFLLSDHLFEPDFGIKTALNTLESGSLKCVDLINLGGDALQKKTQASRSAAIGAFGIDVSRDILRGVTGTPKKVTGFTTVSGADSMFSFGSNIDPSDLPSTAEALLGFYAKDDYKNSFSWVDNVRLVKNQNDVDKLDLSLVNELKKGVAGNVSVVPPEVLKWEDVDAFSFTRAKTDTRPVLETEAYLKTLDLVSVKIEAIKTDRLFIYDKAGREESYSTYKCLYLEVSQPYGSAILFGGTWYEVDKSFMGQIEAILTSISTSKLPFPKVYFWNDGVKDKIESEGDYNERACLANGYYLLDKKLIKSSRTTTPIEFCDLATLDRKLIHVKHRKCQSAGLSHLFAQGAVSAEVLLGDREFRKKARSKLKAVDPVLANLVPLNKVKSSDFEIVFLVLDDSAADVKAALPFFSKVNLARTFEGLSQRGFAVSICGVGREKKP